MDVQSKVSIEELDNEHGTLLPAREELLTLNFLNNAVFSVDDNNGLIAYLVFIL